MAALNITDLPPELWNQIISHSLPESFASLASTCKGVYLLCTPFIEYHQNRRFLYQNVRYKRVRKNNVLVRHVQTAFGLITRIAFEPIAARYIIDADLSQDSNHPRARPTVAVPDIHDGGPVVALFANSLYLREAGLDWKEFYSVIKDECGGPSPQYSQHAATFLLTLLPNVRTVALPRLWKPVESTNKVLDVIVRKSKSSNHPWNTSSLSQLTGFEPLMSTGIRSRAWLDQAMPFLALPKMRSFRGDYSWAISNTPMSLASLNPNLHYRTFLETVSFSNSCIDEGTIAEFLRHTPHLKKFKYSHIPRDEFTEWNICNFVTAIEREVGAHLEELSISITEPDVVIPPGKTSMRGFQCLRKLEFPLEIAMCNLNDAARQLDTANEDVSYQRLKEYDLIGTLVPPSIVVLSLVSRGQYSHDKALQAMFRSFSAKKSSQYPVLTEIHISCPTRPRAHVSYEEECEKLVGELEKTGAVLHVNHGPYAIL
jgi:hypothetical protein